MERTIDWERVKALNKRIKAHTASMEVMAEHTDAHFAAQCAERMMRSVAYLFAEIRANKFV